MEATVTALAAISASADAEPEVVAKPAGGWLGVELARGKAQYLADVAECRRLIAEGETYEVCLTVQATVSGARPAPLPLFRRLRAANPAPYGALLRLGEVAVACSSPECFLRVDAAGGVESKPIKGTAPRGAAPAEDTALADELRGSEKVPPRRFSIRTAFRGRTATWQELTVGWREGAGGEPDDHRPHSPRPRHSLRGRIRGGAARRAIRGRELRHRPPARHDGPREAGAGEGRGGCGCGLLPARCAMRVPAATPGHRVEPRRWSGQAR